MSEAERERAHSVDEIGNTGSISSTNNPTNQHIYWCFTWNGYKSEQSELDFTLSILQHMCKWYIIQEETGESGNDHLQGTLALLQRKRLNQLKQISFKIHWEPTKQLSASACYCSRESKRSGKIWAYNFNIPAICDVKIHEPYGWQLCVMKIINSMPDERTIYWFWEPFGNVGKTVLCKYLVIKHNALMLTGKSNDMYHMISKNPDKRSLFVVDVPKCHKEHINYSAIEQIKNGLIFSGKYEGSQLVFNPPHVIVFANIPPNKFEMSEDRWNINDIKKLQQQPD